MEISTSKIECLEPSQLKDIASMAMPTHMPIPADELESVKAMDKPNRKNWMRNKPCPCERGKKFKVCCWNKYKRGML